MALGKPVMSEKAFMEVSEITSGNGGWSLS
jgi:hypothetical protein